MSNIPDASINAHFTDFVRMELERIRERGDFNSCHEAYGVIAEEFDEFWDEVKAKAAERNYSNMLIELVQIAACCQKAAESLNLVPPERLTKQENNARIKELENLLDGFLTYCEENAIFGEPAQKDGPKPVIIQLESATHLRSIRERLEE